MSAPLVVNTTDGAVWTRRGATRGGEALYAIAGVCDCPEAVMATLAELAEHGIAGMADALPVPAGGPDGITRLLAPTQVLRDVPDGEHYAHVHHEHRLGHDLPETGGERSC